MVIRKFVSRILILVAIIISCYLLQVCIFSRLSIYGVTPNILVGITSIFGFMKGSKRGMLVGFICGMLLDLSSGMLFGALIAVYTTIGFINGLFRKMFFGDDIKLPMVLIFSSNIIYGIIMYVIVLLTNTQFDFVYYVNNVILPESVYTTLVCLFIYVVIFQISTKLDKSEKRRESHIIA